MAQAKRAGSEKQDDQPQLVGDSSREQNDAGSDKKSSRWVTAESIAVATGIGYAAAFLYQVGLAEYYGIPLETIRVSPEWVIFVGVALVPSVFLFLGHSTLSSAIEHSKNRRLIRWLFAILGIVLGGSAPFIGNRGVSALGMLASILLLSLAFSDWLTLKTEGFRSRGKKPNPYLAALAIASSILFLMLWITGLGFSAASGQDAYLVDKSHSRVLVYSTDSLYVFADYDAATSALKPRLTYTAASSLESIQLDYTKTGRLRSGVLSH